MITLIWPPASLSGHAKGDWRSKAVVVAKHREWAYNATLAAKCGPFPDKGDIRILFRFFPPDNRGDRTNYPNRLKPAIDGIAQALGINDKRFLPSYEFFEPSGSGRVEVEFP